MKKRYPRDVIRDAVIDNKSREYQLRQICEDLGCKRSTAKTLYFSFLYNASDKYLNNKFKSLEPDLN